MDILCLVYSKSALNSDIFRTFFSTSPFLLNFDVLLCILCGMYYYDKSRSFAATWFTSKFAFFFLNIVCATFMDAALAKSQQLFATQNDGSDVGAYALRFLWSVLQPFSKLRVQLAKK